MTRACFENLRPLHGGQVSDPPAATVAGSVGLAVKACRTPRADGN
jgi:hypothetical protein